MMLVAGVTRIEGAEERRPASTLPPPPPSTIATVRSFTGDSGLAVITEMAYGDCRGWLWWPMTMALNDDGTQELATMKTTGKGLDWVATKDGIWHLLGAIID